MWAEPMVEDEGSGCDVGVEWMVCCEILSVFGRKDKWKGPTEFSSVGWYFSIQQRFCEFKFYNSYWHISYFL
jgi:hypothetical protein